MSAFILIITQKYSKSHFYQLADNNYSFTLEAEKDVLDRQIEDKSKLLSDFVKQTEWYLVNDEEENYNSKTWLNDYKILDNLKFFYQNNSEFYEQVFLVTPNLDMYTYSDDFTVDLPVKVTEEQYSAASKNEISIITQGRVSKFSGKPIFTITKVIKNDQKIIGIIGSTLDLIELSQEISKKSQENLGETYVIRDGKYLIHYDPKMILQDVDFDSSFLVGDKGSINILGNKVFFTKTQGIYDGYLVSQISYGDLYGEIDKNMFILLLMLIASLAGVIILSYFTVRRITQPVISLKEAMDKATEGDFFAKAEKTTTDELGEAMDSFNILMERIRNLTFFDSLTSLPNYDQFKYWFSQVNKEKISIKKSYSFVLISINGFKKINETYGVEAGDQMIIQIAGRLKAFQKRQPKLNFVSRFTGDEFLLFYKNIENKYKLEDEIILLLRKLNSPYIFQGNTIYLRFVVGGSFCDQCYSNLDFQMSAVSNARSLAKKEKKEFFIIGNKDNILDSLVEIKTLENELHSALEKGELEVYYQPLYCLESNDYFCVEALARYKHPERGYISPVEFIPLAEEIGIIDEIDKFVLEKTIKNMKNLEKKGFKKLDIHINVSPEHLNNDNFVKETLEIPRKYNFSPERIWLEITEDVALFNIEEQEKKILKLKSKGVKISIDDFGTGYSSFLYLNQLSADQIKIDRSFVMNMKDNKKDYEIIKTIVTLAKAIDLDLVTEGVEDQETFDLLKDLGVNKMQGYFFAKPMDILDLEKFLAEHNK